MAISSVSSDLTQDAIDRYLAQPEGNCLAFREGQWQVIQGSQAKAGALEGLFSSSKTSMRPFESTHLCFEKASLEKIDTIFISAVQSTCETLREDINRGKQEIDRNEDTIGLYQKANKKMQSFQKRVHSLHDSLLKAECTMLFDSMKIIFETRVRDFFFSKIESQDLEGITELLTIGNFTSDDIHNAFKVAVDRGYSEVIELLLEKGHISSEYIEAAFKTVYSRQDRLDSLKVFLKSGLIDSQLKEKAMRYAAAQNFIDHMHFFLEDSTFCEYALDQPLKTAIAKGYVEIVKLILGTRSGQNKLKEKGFSQLLVEKAIESGKIEIIDYLLQDRTILINPADT